ncbi:MAG: diguanylate cyclase [Firmicutes bacterium]|nr:diguanylate cyclase [Bacillota bacterium]
MEKRKLILIIDDSATTLKSAGDVLKSRYELAMASSGEKGIDYLKTHDPDLILLDVIMPGMDGFETIKKIKSMKGKSGIPVIFLTGDLAIESESLGFKLGAVYYITKPFDGDAMLYRIEKILEFEALKKSLEEQVKIKTEQLEKMTIHVFKTLSKIVDNKSVYTLGHSQRVAAYANKMAKAINWSEQDATGLYYIALLHDIGKIGISENILSKTSPLTPEEQSILDTHADIGGELLKDFTLIKNLAEGVKYHHCRYDSDSETGGPNIPIEARIIAVADYIDLARTPKEGREPCTDEELIEKLKNERGGQFDPVLVDVAIDMIRSGYVASKINDDVEEDMDVVDFSNAILERVLTEYTEEMKTKAQKDALTGLWNRQYMAQAVNSYLSVNGANGALLMIDLDNFKNINDVFGHLAGDDTLLALSESLGENIRGDDVICRLGGDEFLAFIVSAKTRSDIENICMRISESFSQRMDDINPRIQTSVSIGAALSRTDGRNFETLYSKADKALYFVKQNQKGTYHFYSEPSRAGNSDESDSNESVLYKILNAHGENQALGTQGLSRMINFVEQYTLHSRQKVQVVLFTLEAKSDKSLNAAFDTLHSAVCSNLRRGDVFARYSDTQYIVMLMNVEADIGHKVATRITGRFGSEIKLHNSSDVKLSYEVFSINDDN